MNKHLSLAALFSTSLLLAACGGMDSQSEAAAENNDASLNEDVSELPAFEPSSRPQVLSYSGSSNTATLNQDNMTEVANAALEALSSRVQSGSSNTSLDPKTALSQFSGIFNGDTQGILKAIVKNVTNLPLDSQAKPTALNKDISTDLCESGTATLLGTTNIDKKKAKGGANLDLQFSDCVTKTDGNTLTGVIVLKVLMGLKETDIGMDLNDLDIINKDGKTSQLTGWLNLNIDYKYLLVSKETITWHITTVTDAATLTNLGTVVIDEMKNIKFSTTFEDVSGVSFKLDNMKNKPLSKDVTGTLYLPQYGSLAINTDKLEFCPDAALLKKGNITLSDSLGNLVEITGSGCDTLPIIIPMPKA